jgi:small-conductance mechanosensitive channel
MIGRVNIRKISGLVILLVVVGFLFMSIVPATVGAARITYSNPEDGEDDVPIDAWITIRFNVSMDTESVEENLKISPELKPYGYRLEWSDDDRELLIKPNAAMRYDEEYTITMTGAEDENGQLLADAIFEFSTEESPGILGIFTDMVQSLWDGFMAVIPSLVLLVFVLIIGYIIAKAAGWVFAKLLARLGFDKAMENVGVAKQLRSMGIKSASKFLGIFIFWFIFVIAIQVAIAGIGVPTITNILAPIVLFIPRVLIAAIVILIGLYVANVIVQRLLEQLSKTEIGKQLTDMDKRVKASGFSMVNIVSMFIKIFILLFFVQIALEIINIGLLSEFITPVLLLMPLILVALFVMLIGLIVAEVIRKALLKIFKEFQLPMLIKPVEDTIGKPGIIINLFLFVIRIMVLLIFAQIAIGVLNSTGAFDQLAHLINLAVLWLPNVLGALVILIVGFWIAGWLSNKVLESSKKMDIPFPEVTSTMVKYLVIYLVGVMAFAQLGFEVPILYIATAIILGAVFIGLGAGFAVGSKEIFANIGGYLQNNKILKVGSKVTVDEKYTGTVVNIGHYTTTLQGVDGKNIIIPNSKLIKAVIVEG